MTELETHLAEIEAWRQGRYASLRRDIGWLTLAGLDWLKPGPNRLGTAPDVDVHLPFGPAVAGTISVEGNAIRAEGDFLHDGRPIDRLDLTTDEGADRIMLELGSLRLCVIERGGRLALRTWDLESPVRRDFTGIDHWPVDLRWRIEARLEPTPGRMIEVPDVLGFSKADESAGDVTFEVDGRSHRLQALPGGNRGELWLVFGDDTNRVETYAGGRFLYTAPPDPGGRLVLDFNRAYNPPCVLTPYATCPLPWPENRLPIRVEAGERYPIAR